MGLDPFDFVPRLSFVEIQASFRMSKPPLRTLPMGSDLFSQGEPAAVARQLAEVYTQPGAPRRAIREILGARDPKLLAFLWKASDLVERLDLLARMEAADATFARRFVDRLQLTGDPDPRMRSRVVRILAGSTEAGHRSSLRVCLQDPDARVRADAVEALAPRDAQEATNLFAPLTRDTQPRPRANALLALIRQGCMRARDDLASMLASPAVGAKASARWALNQLLKHG
jgi:hypothetical protein